eukprot:360265-Chlamydomonas_euryale.AAC.5
MDKRHVELCLESVISFRQRPCPGRQGDLLHTIWGRSSSCVDRPIACMRNLRIRLLALLQADTNVRSVWHVSAVPESPHKNVILADWSACMRMPKDASMC